MVELSESASNVVENLACRVAQKHGGRINPHHLFPYLPMSFGLIRSCLDDMVDGTSVLSDTRDNIVEYEFTAYRGAPVEKGLLDVSACVSCDKDLAGGGDAVLCGECADLLRKELNGLAEKTAWPAQAVYEHDIVYHAAGGTDPVPAEDLAGSTIYTLRNMRRKLHRLVLDHYARQELDENAGLMKYHFPDLEYPRDRYKKNMAVIRSYPASVMEEIQLKIVRILFTLGLMFLGMLALAFWGVPFPLLIVLFLIGGPVTAFLIWRHRTRPEED
jgi:hypothetical protein